MAEFDYSKLRGRIIEKFGTYDAFFEILHVSSVMSSKRLNNNAGFSQEDVLEWSKPLDITLKEIGPFFYTLKV